MKAYVSRSPNGAVRKGWLLREGISVHSTMCQLKRTERAPDKVEEASTETVLKGASAGTVRDG